MYPPTKTHVSQVPTCLCPLKVFPLSLFQVGHPWSADGSPALDLMALLFLCLSFRPLAGSLDRRQVIFFLLFFLFAIFQNGFCVKLLQPVMYTIMVLSLFLSPFFNLNDYGSILCFPHSHTVSTSKLKGSSVTRLSDFFSLSAKKLAFFISQAISLTSSFKNLLSSPTLTDSPFPHNSHSLLWLIPRLILFW